MQDEGVTFACMAPTVLRTILDYEDKDQYKIETKPRFTVAGAPPPAAFIERLEKELGWEFLQIYGLTETAPLLDDLAPRREYRRGELGQPLPRWRRRHRRARRGGRQRRQPRREGQQGDR